MIAHITPTRATLSPPVLSGWRVTIPQGRPVRAVSPMTLRKRLFLRLSGYRVRRDTRGHQVACLTSGGQAVALVVGAGESFDISDPRMITLTLGDHILTLPRSRFDNALRTLDNSSKVAV